MSELSAVILDIDGTLLLSNEAHARAFIEAAAKLGIPGNLQRVGRLIGKGSDKLIPEAFGIDSESNLGTKLNKIKGEIFRAHYLPLIQPSPGARDLLLKFRDEGLQRVVATSAGKEDVTQLLKRAGVQDLINDTTSADDANASKPDPDIILAALRKLDISPGVVFMLGDTPYDVEAATRANIRCITVRCGGWHDRDLQGSFAIFDDPADLLDHYDQTLTSKCES